jgi:hypothetical protein
LFSRGKTKNGEIQIIQKQIFCLDIPDFRKNLLINTQEQRNPNSNQGIQTKTVFVWIVDVQIQNRGNPNKKTAKSKRKSWKSE